MRASDLHRGGGVLAAPFPVDTAQLVLAEHEAAQRVAGPAQPGAERKDRLVRVAAVACLGSGVGSWLG